MADRNTPASFTLEEWRLEFNELATDVGDIANLPATVNGNAVTDIIEAVAELQSGLSTVLLPNVIDFDDSTGPSTYRVKFGDSDDLQLYHDGSNSIISHDGTGVLNVDSTSGVELQYGSSTKLATTNTGVDITGNLDVTGNITLGGNITVGDADTDEINFNADLTSDIVPNATATFDLGASGKEWQNIYLSNGLIDNNGITLTFPTNSGAVATEGFSVAMGIALG
jgi:hypothetical protein